MTCIVGQRAAISTLQTALSHGRTQHAWVFRGPRGVGKFTTAIEFARHLLLDDLRGREFGLAVADCEFQHPDLHVIMKEDAAWSNNPSLASKKQTNIPVDLLRERMIGGRTADERDHDAPVFKTSVSGGNKVFILDEAELLDEIAQNALLKILEEPPLGTFVVLVTSREDRLLPTVQSRCQAVGFSLLDSQDMECWAKTVDPEVSVADLSWSIRYSGGSPGDVCESIESELPRLAEKLGDFIHAAGSGDSHCGPVRHMVEFVENFVQQQLDKNSLCSKEAANRRGFSIILKLFGSEVQSLLGDDRDSSSIGIRAAAVLADIESQVRTNISIKVLLESLAVRWVHLCGGTAILMPAWGE